MTSNSRHRLAPAAGPFVFILLLLLAAMPAGAAQKFEDIKWTTGPATVSLGSVGKLKVPAGYRFTDAAGIRIFNELTQNLDNDEIGLLAPPVTAEDKVNMPWFIVFSFRDVGYVKDDEKLDESTINSIFASIKDGTESGNAERQKRGWETLTISGWDNKPFYDEATHHVTWAVRVHAGTGESSNYSSRVLGRRGVMSVNMVVDPADLAKTVPTYNSLVQNVSFNTGENYSEYRSCDKVAQYGLVGLITGGAAVAAVKFWPKLLKFGAIIVAGLLGLGAKIKNMFTRKKA